jgi:ribosome-binding protein aMBF1 (putative translation factor)
MARAALGWSLDALSEASGVNRWTILRFENEESVARPKNREALVATFEAAGVRLLHKGADAGGVVPPDAAATFPTKADE